MYHFLKIQNRLCAVQPQFRSDLIEKVEKFHAASAAFQESYDNLGPMADGISPTEASDRLQVYQSQYVMC